MMDNLINTIELALIIILPLILYYQKIQISFKTYVFYIMLLYLIWFATYSLLHELCHVFGSWITGAEITEYQLIPRFWDGDYKNGYVQSELENRYQLFISPIFPYLRDMFFLFIGYMVLKRIKNNYPFVAGLVLILFVLSPLYDVFNNYIAFVLGAKNDFYCISGVIGSLGVHAIGLLFTLTGLAVLWIVFQILGKQTNKKQIKE
jgi:hypothetical protein